MKSIVQSRFLSKLTVFGSALLIGSLTGVALPASAATAADATLSIFAGNGTSGVPTAGPATASPYVSLVADAVDSVGNVYINDYSSYLITKVTPGGTQTIFAGNGLSGAPTAGPALASRLGEINNMTFDKHDNLYLADFSGNVIEKITPAGVLSIIAGNGTTGAPTPGPVANSSLYEPGTVAVDGNDNVYVALYNAARIVKITPSGTLSFFAGNGTSGPPVDGPALGTPIIGTFGITFDNNNNLFINPYDGYCQISKVTQAGMLSRYAGNGTCGASTQGPATSTSIGYVYGTASFDFQGNLYFADTSNNTVEKVTPSGILSTVAGVQGVRGTPTTGLASSSRIGDPFSTVTDPQGNVYVTDSYYNKVEKITVPTAPSAPTAVAATFADGSVTASWTAPKYGNAATSYTVTSTVNGVTGSPITGLTAVNYHVANVAAGSTYAFAVQAVNANGTSPTSVSNTVTKALAPPVSGIATPIYVGPAGAVTQVPVANSANISTQVTASTPTGLGSWTLGADGGVFTAGDAPFFGSHGGSPMNGPAVGLAVVPGGSGYLIAGTDGGVFTYGSAAFKGSMGDKRLNKPVTGIASTCSGNGYYLVAGDGGVFTFGDAGFHGSMADKPLNQPMVGIADACSQSGYWTFAKDGGVFTFGGAGFYGSLANRVPAGGVIGMISAPDGKGYWLIGADKKAYGFGSVAN